MSTIPLRTTAALVVITCLSLPAATRAQSAPEQAPPLTIGLGADWMPSPYRGYDTKVWPLPLIDYEGQMIYVRGATAGLRFFNAGGNEFSVIVSPMAQRFEHDDTDNPQLRQLSDREISGLAGLAWRYRADWGVLATSAQKEFTGHGGGALFDASYSYPIHAGVLTLSPTIGANYASGALDNYYYGVGAVQAQRSGLLIYHPGGGTQPYLGIVASYRIAGSWIVSTGVHYASLPNAVKDSPMVDAGHTRNYFVGLSYAFR